MSRIVFIRHGRTEWNDSGRLTGRADIPLSEEGRAQLSGYRIPAAFAAATWLVSPLSRAQQTAALLGIADGRIEPRLAEMDFGAFEGRTLADLRAEPTLNMAKLEAQGLDFQPPHGESPRAVQRRIVELLRDLGPRAGRGDALFGAVAHKAVIRAVMALAYDWPMLGKPPVRLDWRCMHLFSFDEKGRPAPLEMNIPLAAVQSSEAKS